MRRCNRCLRIMILAFLLVSFTVTLLFGQNDTSDPIEISFNSNDDKIHGWFYKAKGAGPFPTVVLLHGFPGRDGDLYELGRSLAEEGFNALTFNYSGTWRSEGIWTPITSLTSVESAIEFLQQEETIRRFGIDTTSITLIGDSYGGGMALLGAIHNGMVKRVVSIAGGDLYVIGKLIEENPDFRKAHQQYLDECMSDSTVCRGYGGRKTHEFFLEYKDDFNLLSYADVLCEKDILFVGGWIDYTIPFEDHALPLYRSLKKLGAQNVEICMFDTDHSFGNVQDKLRSKIVSWLKK